MRESKVSRTAQRVKNMEKGRKEVHWVTPGTGSMRKGSKNTRMCLKDTGESDQVKAG